MTESLKKGNTRVKSVAPNLSKYISQNKNAFKQVAKTLLLMGLDKDDLEDIIAEL